MGTGTGYDDGAHGDGGPGGGAGRGRGGGAGDDVEALLRDRLRHADERIETPPGLWARIQASGPAPVPASATSLGGRSAPSRRRTYALALTVAATVAAVAVGVGWLVRPGAEPRPAAAVRAVPVTVYNSESACRRVRSLECALRLARNPHARYAAPDNAAGRVWHGDVVAAHCVVIDGRMVRDEEGVTSTRWYLVTGTKGETGWLPGVRTRNTREVPDCSRDVI
ncbi:hypothetical protein [Streptomyces sp. NPDC048650]|uniref:hypothetical protein n=1 Tax=unclassified Streptomyces TaxID=2593676 RepID=UPI0037114CAA